MAVAGGSSDRVRTLGGALLLYAVWTLATWLLEGRMQTLLRPDAAGARLAYAVVANLIVGILGAGFLIRHRVRRTPSPETWGFAPRARTLRTALAGFCLGAALFLLLRPASLHPAVLVHAFAQAWVVSTAEVLVCWAALGGAVVHAASRTGLRKSALAAAWLVSAAAFGAYHFAHSPPFDTWAMVGLLSLIGLVTGAFFFLVRDVWGTILLHNFLALKGITDALARGGQLEAFRQLQLPLLATALTAAALLAAVHSRIRRQAPRP